MCCEHPHDPLPSYGYGETARSPVSHFFTHKHFSVVFPVKTPSPKLAELFFVSLCCTKN